MIFLEAEQVDEDVNLELEDDVNNDDNVGSDGEHEANEEATAKVDDNADESAKNLTMNEVSTR